VDLRSVRGVCWICESCVRSVRGVCASGESFVRSESEYSCGVRVFFRFDDEGFFFSFFFLILKVEAAFKKTQLQTCRSCVS